MVSPGQMNGLTATRSIIGKFPAARIVVVTEHDNEETREHAFTAGACDFLGKSALRRLRTLIGGR